jgi:hypothetical protein
LGEFLFHAQGVNCWFGQDSRAPARARGGWALRGWGYNSMVR